MSERNQLFTNSKKYLFEKLKAKAFDLGISKPKLLAYLANDLKYNFCWRQSEAHKKIVFHLRLVQTCFHCIC